MSYREALKSVEKIMRLLEAHEKVERSVILLTVSRMSDLDEYNRVPEFSPVSTVAYTSMGEEVDTQ